MDLPKRDGGAHILGVVGGIASGKSEVARILAEEGNGVVVDADEIAHVVLNEGEVQLGIMERWGREILDDQGGVDRTRLAAIVFGDACELEALNEIVHPEIRRRIEASLRESVDSVPLIVIDAALLVESGLHTMCDTVVWVDCDLETRVARASDARGWDAEEVPKREKHQLPSDVKRNRADERIDNSGSRDETRGQLRKLLERIESRGGR